MRGAVIGVVVGLIAVAAIATTTGGGNRAAPRKATATTSSSATDAYLAAWRRSQLGTWRVVLRWERQAGGSRLDDQIRITQRPPDRLSVGAGSVDARQDGRRLACAAGEDGRLRCRDAGPAPAYDGQVDRAEAVLRAELTGPQALYDVSGAGPGCYELRLRFARFPAPPYGRRARFCYDRSTGAPTLLDVERAEGRDRQTAIEVSGRVSDADLAPPPGLPG